MSSSSPSLLNRTTDALWGLLDPWLFLATSASYLPRTIITLLRARRLDVLLSPRKLQDAWFGAFWDAVSPRMTADDGGGAATISALLEGRTSAGALVDAPAHPGIGGVVLETGPGSGMWVRFLAGRGVERVFGVEPNAESAAKLRRAVEGAGLADVYTIVPVGVEDLEDGKKWDGRVEKGSVDCIVSVLCLCSIPEPERNIRELYGYLKKGGRWYVYEHVRCEYSWYMRAYQRFVNLFWPHFIGGCLLCRQTGKTLAEAGPWADIDVGQPQAEPWHKCLPHIMGVYTK
ncbi:S-adenosyl-L-methionine-dependent methyltransferase [Whalleya microplaca]|nr:S-adenosyl-L-methionine-dependent methyltransferase [Whalleya microplaca]